jgi:signal transduction histidine kinase
MTTYDRTRRVLFGTFAVIAVLLGATQLFFHLQTNRVDREASAKIANAVESVRQVNRLARDIAEERILVSRHILLSQQVDWRDIERRIDATRRDYDDAVRAYIPLVTFPGEGTAWYQLTSDVSLVRERLVGILALSRENQDLPAQRQLFALDPVYQRIEAEAARLISINQGATDGAIDQVAATDQRSEHLRLLVGAAVLALTLLAAMWVAHAVLRNQRELVRATAALDERNRELDAFAARVSHDLRKPLSTIKLAASVAAERAPQLAATSSILGRGIDQMSALIDDLLELSRVGAAPQAAGDVGKVAGSLLPEVDALVSEVGGVLRYELGPSWVSCSERLLHQVLWNLCENAVKYRRKDVQLALELRGRARDGTYEIRISDNGVGMTEEDARHAFEPFYRSPLTSRTPGTGLGLSIVHRVIEASRGSIGIDSAPGLGTTFTIRLPRARPPDPRRAIAM